MTVIENPLTFWFDLWSRSTQLAMSMPPLAGPRLDFLPSSGPWPPAALIESQQMLWEKTVTLHEMWWNLWAGTCSPAALLSTRGWDGQEAPAAVDSVDPPVTASPAEPRSAKRLRHG